MLNKDGRIRLNLASRVRCLENTLYVDDRQYEVWVTLFSEL
jgi:hypothetical protein